MTMQKAGCRGQSVGGPSAFLRGSLPPSSCTLPSAFCLSPACRGSVLVVVLVVCLGLVSLALVLGHSMLMAYRGADNEIAGRQADAAILGGARYARSLMTSATSLPDPTTYQSAAVPVGDALFWFIGEPPNGAAASDQPSFGLVDEAGKLNLNRASFDMVRRLPGMTDDLAQAIVAWRTLPGNANAATVTAPGSAPAKQGFMESVDEVGLIVGAADPTLLSGDDANLNHVLDPEETSTAGNLAQGQLGAGLLEYCTVYSREPNLDASGNRKPGINTNPGFRALPGILDAALGGGRGRSVMTAVITSLENDRPPAAAREPGGSTAPPDRVASLLELYARSGLSAADFTKLQPYLANSTGGPYTCGLINVNTASQTVLACVPGIGDAGAAALVGSRTQRGTGADPSDLSWVVAVLGAHNCRAAGPWLTTRSYQWSADVAAVGRYGRGYRRARFVLDSSTGTPQIVHRRDLAGLGWALGRDERANSLRSAGLAQGGATP